MRRELFYVRIDHLSQPELLIAGYSVIIENDEFWLIQGYDGDEQIVRKSFPFLLVDDVNDANAIKATSGFVFTKLDRN